MSNKVGLSIPLPAYTIDPAFMGAKAEELGFNSIWYAEHPATPVETNSPFPATGGEVPITYSHFTEPYIALALLPASPKPFSSAPASRLCRNATQ